MREELRRDRVRYADLGGAWGRLGYWVGATYRLGMWAYSLPRILRIPVLILYRIAKIPWIVVLNVNIPVGPKGARIGPGLCLIHPRNILLAGGSVIGENFLVFNDVTLGSGAKPGRPVIGNDVDVYIGARILGGISVGDRSMIGANCVITRNVRPGSIVLQAPARVIPRSLAVVARVGDRARDPSAPVTSSPAPSASSGDDEGEEFGAEQLPGRVPR
jgi:serine O-acetyltransferase